MSESPTIWMPLDIGDYLADTMDLSAEQHGAYILLIMHYWKNASPLKNDKNSLKNVTKISSKNTQEILSRFFHLFDGRWHHKRIDKELIKAKEKKEKSLKQTSQATASRWQKTVSVTENLTDTVTGLRAETPLPLPLPKDTPEDLSAGERKYVKEIFSWLEKRINSPSKFYIEAPIVAWLGWGADFEIDIKPAVERYFSKGKSPPNSLDWFGEYIAASIQQRSKPMPEMPAKQIFKSFEQKARENTDLAIEEVMRRVQPAQRN